MDRVTIAVIDGQGAGVGKALVERLRLVYEKRVYVLALGTNSLATSLMLKAGADVGATGENAIVVNAGKVDVIMGALGVLAADSMLGEITAAMANAIGRSEARKILLPINRCNLSVVGLKNLQFTEFIEEAVAAVEGVLSSGRQ